MCSPSERRSVGSPCRPRSASFLPAGTTRERLFSKPKLISLVDRTTSGFAPKPTSRWRCNWSGDDPKLTLLVECRASIGARRSRGARRPADLAGQHDSGGRRAAQVPMRLRRGTPVPNSQEQIDFFPAGDRRERCGRLSRLGVLGPLQRIVPFGLNPWATLCD